MQRGQATVNSPLRRSALLVGVFAGALALAACSSGSAADSGVVTIEKKLAGDIGLGDLDAECTEPDGLKEGETFTCTATTADGETIEFLGTMTSDDAFNIVTTNLLLASDIDTIVQDAATQLSTVTSTPIQPADIECPAGSVVLDDAGDFICALTNTATGDVYDLTVSTGGLEPGVGAKDLYYQIADQPR